MFCFSVSYLTLLNSLLARLTTAYFNIIVRKTLGTLNINEESDNEYTDAGAMIIGKAKALMTRHNQPFDSFRAD